MFPNSAEISDTALAALQEEDDAWQPTMREISERNADDHADIAKATEERNFERIRQVRASTEVDSLEFPLAKFAHS